MLRHRWAERDFSNFKHGLVAADVGVTMAFQPSKLEARHKAMIESHTAHNIVPPAKVQPRDLMCSQLTRAEMEHFASTVENLRGSSRGARVRIEATDPAHKSTQRNHLQTG